MRNKLNLRAMTALLLALLLLCGLSLSVFAHDTGEDLIKSDPAEPNSDDGLGGISIIPPGGSDAQPNGDDASQTIGDPEPDRESEPASDPRPQNTEPAESGSTTGFTGLQDGDKIWLTETMAYDAGTRDFAYPIGDSGVEAHANVANGMIVNTPVRIQGNTLLVYRNRELIDEDLTNLTTPGEYVVMGQTGNQTPRLFTFTLVGETVGNVYSYNMPTGMMVTAATREGEEIYFDRYSVPMQDSGLYHIEYECLSTGIGYTLDVTVDRDPPELIFSGSIDERNRVHSALRFSNVQADETVQAILDGVPVEVTVNADGTGELLQSGNYVITAFDAAGNSSQYTYTVLIYFNASSMVFLALLILAILAVAIYVCVKRKRLKIG